MANRGLGLIQEERDGGELRLILVNGLPIAGVGFYFLFLSSESTLLKMVLHLRQWSNSIDIRRMGGLMANPFLRVS